MEWSEKQASFIAHSDAFINLADGAVRSGKTHSNLVRFAEYCLTGPPGDLGLLGKTERTVKRNVVLPLQILFPGAVKHVQGSGELYVFGRRCWLFGANDVKAQEKVQGSTLSGGYMNEVTLYPEDLFNQAISRSMSIAGAQWFADCNPNSPYHWMMSDYIQAGHPKTHFKRWRFRLEDNPTLPPENVEMLKALYGPGSLFYRRNIDGEWVMAEGAIYDQFSEDEHVVERMPGEPSRVVVGVDYGTQNATVFLAAGKVGSTWYAFDEYYHSGRETGRQKTDAEYSADFLHWVEKLGYTPSSVEVDPSAASFKAQLRKDGVRKIRDADHAVIDGIRVISTALTGGTLKVTRNCERTIREFPNYVWDEKKQERGVDEPLKSDEIHALDALRYLAMRALGRPALTLVQRPAGL